MADNSRYATAVELRDMLEEIIAKNPEAVIVHDVGNGMGYVVLDGFNTELDDEGDARFTLRSYETGKRVDVTEVEEDIYSD